MPPKRVIEYTVFIFDHEAGIREILEQFYTIYASKVFRRNIKTKSIDQYSIIRANTPENNDVEVLTDWSYYQLQKLKAIRDGCNAATADPDDDKEMVQHPHKPKNLLRAINDALTSLDNIDDKKNILNKRVVLFTDLKHPISSKEEYITKMNTILKDSKATLYILGVDAAKIPQIQKRGDIKKLFKLNYFDEKLLYPEVVADNLNIIRRISNNNIMVLNYQEGYHILFAHRAQTKQPYTWYVSLGIGTDLRVRVMCHKTTRQFNNVKFARAPIIPGQRISKDKKWYEINTHLPVEHEDVALGYKFHKKVVYLTAEQMSKIKRKPKYSKCLNILSFVAADQVPLDLYHLENSSHVVKPDRRSVRGKTWVFRKLVAAMRTKNVVAITKRVYNNGNAPKLFALYPCPEHKTNKYLRMVQLPFAHQFKKRYIRGVAPKLEKEDKDSALKQNVFDFLDAVATKNYPNGQPVAPLAEKYKFNQSRTRFYKYLAKRNLDEEPGELLKVKMNPYVAELAEGPLEKIVDYLNVD